MPTASARASLLVAVLLLPLAVRAENWPQWRGPEGNGVSRDTNVAIAWNESSGTAWKTKLAEWGCSTPAVWDDAVFPECRRGFRADGADLASADGAAVEPEE